MGKKLNLLGQTFGQLTVKKEYGRSTQGYVIWECLCSCGKYVKVTSNNLRSGNTRSCGCIRKEKKEIRKGKRENRNFKNLLGQTFGQLTVIEKTEKRRKRRVVWKCRCSCGNYKEVSSDRLEEGMVKSCGCLRKRKGTVENHMLSHTPLYHVWTCMKQRCQNPKASHYKYYGLLGVEVCEKWRESFIEFYKWAKENGYRKGLSIDRINPFGNYEPDNCRWATTSEQNKNKRNSPKNKQ